MTQIEINSLRVGNGTVALSPLPGRGGGYLQDLRAVRDWRPDLVISMTTEVEMVQEGADGFGDDLRDVGIRWVHLPIEDFGAPSPHIQALWSDVAISVGQTLSAGGRVLAHCRGGCGRSGMIVLRIMIEAGEPPETALRRLRSVRPCAVETEGQMEWAALAALL